MSERDYILIQNGRVIDPSQGMDRVTNLLVADGRIAAYDATPAGQETVLDAAGKIVAPGLIDMHVHLREPGFEEDETIETGTAAALAGGFTSIACMPNTDPPTDTQAAVEFIRDRAARADNCNVLVVACVSRNREGKELAEIGRLVEAGAVGFSDDGAPVYDAELMRRALEYCLMFDKPVLSHAEIRELTQQGVMHDGLTSLVLGLTGIPAAAEDAMTARDVALAEATGGRLHLMHVSTGNSVEIVRRAKSRGVRVTAEATPHHFSLTDESLRTFDANFKMNPPLRGREHVEAVAGRAGRRHDRRRGQRPRPARPRKENAGTRPGPVRRRRAGDFARAGRHQADRAGTARLAHGNPQNVPESGQNPGPRQGDAPDRRPSRRDHHRPQGPLDGRSGAVPLEERQHALCRLGVDRPGGGGDRGRAGEVSERGIGD